VNNLYGHSIIVAQSTPQGPGALALIRLTGSGVFDLIDKCIELPFKKKISEQGSHSVHYGTFVTVHREPIDHALFIKMDAPRTFTGYDTIEITCHNNIFITNAILETIIFYGGRLAEPGEFTRLAVLNKKLDLIQAEAIDELIHAASLAHVKSALKQLGGSFSAWIGVIEERLLTLLSLTNASFEFIEEENIDFINLIRTHLDDLVHDIETVEKKFDAQTQLKEGFRIALIGAVNAGKSSLFNIILGKNRAIVHHIPGTTRDVIEAIIAKNGYFWTLIDTAGIRSTNDLIEQEGINRSFEQAALADVILLVYDSSRTMSFQEQSLYNTFYETYNAKIIKVYNKDDHTMCLSEKDDSIHCSALLNKGIDTLVGFIEKKISALCQNHDVPFLVNKRHLILLQTMKNSLANVILLCKEEKVAYELVSCQLHDILVQLSENSGKTVNHKMMDRVFATFCVGK